MLINFPTYYKTTIAYHNQIVHSKSPLSQFWLLTAFSLSFADNTTNGRFSLFPFPFRLRLFTSFSLFWLRPFTVFFERVQIRRRHAGQFLLKWSSRVILLEIPLDFSKPNNPSIADTFNSICLFYKSISLVPMGLNSAMPRWVADRIRRSFPKISLLPMAARFGNAASSKFLDPRKD